MKQTTNRVLEDFAPLRHFQSLLEDTKKMQTIGMKEVIVLFEALNAELEQHLLKDVEPHCEAISKMNEEVMGKLRNHRHEIGKEYGAKPEF